MIYTVTFNPALDYVVRVKDLKMGKTNRSYYESISAGGKGINVSTVLRNLGHDSVAFGFVAGFTGKQIADGCAAAGINVDFTEVSGLSRINVKIKAGEETEINAQGPAITQEAQDDLMRKLDGIGDGDYLVLAGSVPSSLPSDIYEKMLERLSNRGVRAIVDATGELLKRVLKFEPFLVKPNTQELGELFGVEISSVEEAFVYAEKLRDMGAKNVIVSMGGDGAIMAAADGKKYSLAAPQGKVVDTVGSGDSLVAGFISGIIESGDYGFALKKGVATGSASAFREGLATKEEVENVLASMQ